MSRWKPRNPGGEQKKAKVPQHLTPRQKAFAVEYVKDFRIKRAALAAGYAENTAAKTGYKMLQNPVVRQEVDRLLEEATKSVGIGPEWVLAKWVDLYEKCMQIQEVTDKKGNPTGEYTFDSAGAARALDAIGRFTGGFDQRHRVNVESDSLQSLLAELDGGTVRPPREREVFEQSGRPVIEHQEGVDQEE